MKLYTEEQVRVAYNLGFSDANNNFGRKEDETINFFTPIELPRDEEEDIINLWNWLNDGYVIRRSLPTIEELIGWFEAKWMKEQILNQNK